MLLFEENNLQNIYNEIIQNKEKMGEILNKSEIGMFLIKRLPGMENVFAESKLLDIVNTMEIKSAVDLATWYLTNVVNIEELIRKNKINKRTRIDNRRI